MRMLDEDGVKLRSLESTSCFFFPPPFDERRPEIEGGELLFCLEFSAFSLSFILPFSLLSFPSSSKRRVLILELELRRCDGDGLEDDTFDAGEIASASQSKISTWLPKDVSLSLENSSIIVVFTPPGWRKGH